MNKLYNDPYGDRHKRIIKIYSLPENYNVKEAGERPNNVLKWCAQPEKTQYPIDTPERTVVSWCHANEDRELTGTTRNRVLSTIKEAADWWNVKLPEARTEEVGPAYTFTVKHASGEDEYAVNNTTDLKKYAETIIKEASDYSYETRNQIANAILDAPAHLKNSLDTDTLDKLQLAAGEMMVSKYDIKAACDIRASYLDNMGRRELGTAVRQLGGLIKDDKHLTKDVVVKIATEIDRVDRSAGFTVYYGSGALAPVEHSFGGVPYTKVKEAADDMLILNDKVVTSKRAIAANRDQVDAFFMKIAGEDTTEMSTPAILDKLENMDTLLKDAFIDINFTLTRA